MNINSRFNYSWQFVAIVWAVAIALVLGMNATSFGAGTNSAKACVNKSSGAMRYVTTGKCKKNERVVAFGGAGAQGATGSVGAPGAAGDIGPQGLQGPAGPQGLQGPAGPQGLQGPAGPQGLQGEVGPQGLQGDIGPVGAAGSNATVQFGSMTTYKHVHDLTNNWNSVLSGNYSQTWGILNGQTRGEITIGTNEPFQLTGTVMIDNAASDFTLNYGLCAFTINSARIGFGYIPQDVTNQSLMTLVYSSMDWAAGTYSIGIDCTSNVSTNGASLNIIVN